MLTSGKSLSSAKTIHAQSVGHTPTKVLSSEENMKNTYWKRLQLFLPIFNCINSCKRTFPFIPCGYVPPSTLKLLQPGIPFDAKRPLNCSQHLHSWWQVCKQLKYSWGPDLTWNINGRYSEQMCPVWAKHAPVIQGVNCVKVLAVKMVTKPPVEWAMSLRCCKWWILYCKVQGLSVMSTQVISGGYPTLCRYGRWL